MPTSYKVLGQAVSAASTIAITNKAVTDNVVTLTTGTPHRVVVGQYVSISENATVRNVTNKALTSNVATLTVGSGHRILVGQSITVAGVDATFNGTYTVTAVAATTISYNVVAANVTSTASSGTVSFSDLAFNGTFLVDGNASDTTFTYTYTTPNVASTAMSGGSMSYDPWVTAYTCPNATSAIISTIAIANQSGVTATYQLGACADLDPDRKELFVWNDNVPAGGQTFITIGVTLDATVKYLLFGCDTAGVSINVFGSEIS